MTPDQVLEDALSRIGSDRLRYLCLDHPDPLVREEYGAWVLARDAGQPAPVLMPRPSPATRVATALKAGARWIAGGLKVVPDPVFEARMKLCRGCDHYDAGNDQCVVCTCYLAAKARLPGEECPLGKWRKYAVTKTKCGGCSKGRNRK